MTFLDNTGLAYFWSKLKALFATKSELEVVRQSASKAYHYKGSVATVSDLPANAEQGDVYNVGTTLDGDNYAWTGTAWDKLGASVDLSPYALDANVVKLSGDQTVGGVKIFTSAPKIQNNYPIFSLNKVNDTQNVNPSDIRFTINGDNEAVIRLTNSKTLIIGNKSGTDAWANGAQVTLEYGGDFTCRAQNATTGTALRGKPDGTLTWGGINVITAAGGTFTGVVTINNQTNARSIIPNVSNSYTLGVSGTRWKEIWCNQSSINTSSDERIKQQIADIPDAVLDAWGDVDWIQFKYNDAVAEKGADKARLHNGLIAQRVDGAFKAHGLDASKYGLFLYDEWEATPEQTDDDGNVILPAQEAGDAYGLRYTEALCMEAAYQRRRADRAEAKMAELEKRISKLESVFDIPV